MPRSQNFTIKDPSKKRIRFRICPDAAGNVSFGVMKLWPAYSQSYSLSLAYWAAAEPFFRSSGAGGSDPPAPSLVDSAGNTYPPLPSNAVYEINKIARVPYVDGSGRVASLGYSGALNLQAGVRRYADIKVEPADSWKYVVEQPFYNPEIVPTPIDAFVNIWAPNPIGAEAPFAIAPEDDPDDPLVFYYTIPFSPFDARIPEWIPGSTPRAYFYTIGDSLEGIIRNGMEIPGTGPSAGICESGVVE